MKKSILCIFLSSLLSITTTTLSAPITIVDNYYGADDHGWGDRIGNDNFEVTKMVVELDGSSLTVDIYSNYFANVGLYGTELGDLFISTDGWNPYKTDGPNYLDDDSSNGTIWNYALKIDNPMGTSGVADLIDLPDVTPADRTTYDTSVLTSDEVFGQWTYRNGQEVRVDSTNSIDEGSWSISADETFLSFTIDNDIFSDKDLGFHWTMTCGNDVIEGEATAPVPEPATIFLLGFGLLGLAGFSRKKKS